MENHGQLFGDLVRLEIELWDAVDARLRADCGLGLGSFQVLQVIQRTDPCRVYDIVQGLSITVGGASKAVDRIEKAGHCARRSNPDDRRSSIIELTPDGAEVLERATAVFEAELRERLALEPDELAQFRATITRLRALGRSRAAGR
jgi:MarR family transcriptional regulator, organic hydroperoxide resistance regulator